MFRATPRAFLLAARAGRAVPSRAASAPAGDDLAIAKAASLWKNVVCRSRLRVHYISCVQSLFAAIPVCFYLIKKNLIGE